MSKKVLHFLILLSAALIVVIIAFLSIYGSRVATNPAGTVGNTAGNLYNQGLFCEDTSKVYFSNAYDGGTLYSMNPDETDFKKITSGAVKNINVAGNHLYYNQSNASGGSGLGFVLNVSGIYRSTLKGNSQSCLFQGLSSNLIVLNNTVYYLNHDDPDGPSLYKMDLNGNENQKLSSTIIIPASGYDGYLYYHGTEKDHYLYRLDSSNDSTQVLWKQNVWNPIKQGDYIYYMDISSNYRLCRYHLTEDTIQVLSNDRIDMFNVYGSYVYFQKSSSSEPALKRIRIDGTGEEVIADGIYENISITSNYVYFNKYKESTPVYKTPTNGPVKVSEFVGAEEAALENN